MNRVLLGALLDIVFGLIDMAMTVLATARNATPPCSCMAFFSRFAIGLLAANGNLRMNPMTLVAIDLRVPVKDSIHSEHDFWHALLLLAPEIFIYLMSFLTLGIFWIGQQSQLNHLRRSDIRLTWIHLLFLFAVTPTPLSTNTLAEYRGYRCALIEYWVNILIFGIILYVSWAYATRAALLKDDISKEVTAAICRRIIIGQSC